ncbi:MAG: metallophosphoesterase-like protein [Satyrvirus sp.]|uniref:Metallophosphoesterase-like protein n=1 Tax=Satyrvirus sp. TaxID=2487771 RepID=A0A3G5AI59_9VIRU|nr:MAG: metallophosphoesterase-like protein [Satyrvirus sp.]
MISKILRYGSDFHLEMMPNILHPKLVPYWDFKTGSNTKYYLALVGDIGNPYNTNLCNFFDKISDKYEKIFYVPGNHEYYNLAKLNFTKEQFDDELRKICDNYENVVLLNNQTYMLDNIKIIGSTLWSNVPATSADTISRYMNDYHLIKTLNGNITVEDTNKWNKESVQFIENEIISAKNPCGVLTIVLTHHAPLFSDNKNYTADPIYSDSPYKYGFHNDLKYLMKKPVAVWLYGHTHYCSKFMSNNVIVATNQLGYSHEKGLNFDSYAHINLNKLVLNNL